MCDLFALCGLKGSDASRSLPSFGIRARKNMDGWGIGFFRQGKAHVEKSAKQVFTTGHLLSNGSLVFAFTNHRHFMVLKSSRQLESALLLTTVAEGLSPEPWQMFAAEGESNGLLLLIVGGEIIMQEPVSPAGACSTSQSSREDAEGGVRVATANGQSPVAPRP